MKTSDVKTQITGDERKKQIERESETKYSVDNLPPLVEYEVPSSYDINSEIESEITAIGSRIT